MAQPGKSVVESAEAILAAAREQERNPSDHGRRRDLLVQVEALRATLEDPREAMFRQFTNFCETAVLRALMKMNALANIPRDASISASELASKIGVDQLLLTRLMRVISSTGIVKATGPDEFAHSTLSVAFLEGNEVNFWKLMVEEILPVIIKLHEYLGVHKAEDTCTSTQNPFCWYNNIDGKNYYESLLDDPARLQLFNIAMSTEEAALPVLGMFPFDTLTPDENDKERAVIVDVGGGRGHSMVQIKNANPNFSGRIVLQDRKAVLDAVPDDQLPGIEKMVHDFYTPQPVKHAKAYYLRRIMHNWPDSQCKIILGHLADAMAPDSRLLIGEMVVPERADTGTDPTPYWMDMAMLMIGGRERSEKEFSAVLDDVGLQLIKVWKAKVGVQSVLEVKLKGK